MPNIRVTVSHPPEGGDPSEDEGSSAEWADAEAGELAGEEGDPEDLDDQYLRLVMSDDREGRGEPQRWEPGADHGLPSTVEVGEREYTVRAFFPDRVGWWSGRLLGCFDFTAGLIWVQAGQSLEGLRETLLHEVLHAVDRHTGAGGGEEMVGWMAPAFLEALRRNSGLASFLLNPRDRSGDAEP